METHTPRIVNLFISRDESRLRAGWRLLIHGLMILFFIMILGIIVAIVLLISGFQFTEKSEAIPTSLEILLTFLPFLIATIIARIVLDRRTFRSLGFDFDRHTASDLLIGFLIPALQMSLIFLFEWSVGWLKVDTFAWQMDSSTDWPLIILGGMIYFTFVAFQEELISRGYHLQNLIEGLNLPLAVLISSLIFALLHLANPHASFFSTLGIFASGIFLAYAWIRTHRLWLCIGLHTGWNFFQGNIFGFPVSGTVTPSLIHHAVEGPVLLTGGAFGPEAGLILLPTLAVGAFLIWLYTRSRDLQVDDPSLANGLFKPHIH